MRVPEDVSVVGFNDQGLAEIYDPPLTTIHVPTCELGRHAMLKLQRVLAHAPVEMDHVLPTQLIVRATTGPAPTAAVKPRAVKAKVQAKQSG